MRRAACRGVGCCLRRRLGLGRSEWEWVTVDGAEDEEVFVFADVALDGGDAYFVVGVEEDFLVLALDEVEDEVGAVLGVGVAVPAAALEALGHAVDIGLPAVARWVGDGSVTRKRSRLA